MSDTTAITVPAAAHAPGATGPLAGIRIVDLSAVISGPFATAMLADQGADVIVVEQAHAPDIIRASGPLGEGTEGISALYASMNRNKRAIALDLKNEAGREVLLELVAGADVVVQNFRPGAIDRLGLGWEVLSAVNPELVMCSVSGFGSEGPYSNRPAFDPIVQSVAGYPSVQLDQDGVPKLVATAVCDKVTSMHVAQAVCAALVGRALGKGGQHIEIAMVDAGIHFLWPEAMWNYTYLDHETDMPDLSDIYTLFETADGWAMIYPMALETHWRSMCEVLGRPDLAVDPRFADLQGRVRHGDDVNVELQAETRRFTTADLVALMDRADVPAAPVNTRQSMIDDPHIRYRGTVAETVHPTAGRIRQVNPPARFSKTPSSLHRPAPCFGEHTDEVLGSVLGRTPQQIAELRASGAVR